MNGGDDGTRTRGLCRDSLSIHVLSATYILAGAANALKRTVGTAVGKFAGKNRCVLGNKAFAAFPGSSDFSVTVSSNEAQHILI